MSRFILVICLNILINVQIKRFQVISLKCFDIIWSMVSPDSIVFKKMHKAVAVFINIFNYAVRSTAGHCCRRLWNSGNSLWFSTGISYVAWEYLCIILQILHFWKRRHGRPTSCQATGRLRPPLKAEKIKCGWIRWPSPILISCWYFHTSDFCHHIAVDPVTVGHCWSW